MFIMKLASKMFLTVRNDSLNVKRVELRGEFCIVPLLLGVLEELTDDIFCKHNRLLCILNIQNVHMCVET